MVLYQLINHLLKLLVIIHDLYSQAYFAYDSKKAGGTTRSNLRFGASPIRATYYVNNADFISCSLDNYVLKYDMLKNLRKMVHSY